MVSKCSMSLNTKKWVPTLYISDHKQQNCWQFKVAKLCLVLPLQHATRPLCISWPKQTVHAMASHCAWHCVILILYFYHQLPWQHVIENNTLCFHDEKSVTQVWLIWINTQPTRMCCLHVFSQAWVTYFSYHGNIMYYSVYYIPFSVYKKKRQKKTRKGNKEKESLVKYRQIGNYITSEICHCSIIFRLVAFMTNTGLSDLSIVCTCDIHVYPMHHKVMCFAWLVDSILLSICAITCHWNS